MSARPRKSAEAVDASANDGGVFVGTIGDIGALTGLLEQHIDPRVALVLKLPVAVAQGAAIHRTLMAWAQACSNTLPLAPRACSKAPPLALVVPVQCVAPMRSVAMDLAHQGAYVGVFSERDLPFAMKHAARERQIALIDQPPRLRQLGADAAEALGEMKEARALLHGFTRAGMAQRVRRPTNFEDIYAVAALELHGKTTESPSDSKSIGAWLSRLKDRGEGDCTALRCDSEGRYVLVLDTQAVDELREAMAEHRADVASYAQLQEDLAHLRKLRRSGAGRGKANR